MRRWLHCLLVALLCVTLFVDSARACFYLRQRSRRTACPPPVVPATPCCPPGRLVGGWVAPAWSTPSCGGAAGYVVSDRLLCDPLVTDGIVTHGVVEHGVVVHERGGCECGDVAGWHEGHVVEHGVVEHGVVEHGVVEHGVVEHDATVQSTVPGDARAADGETSRVVEHGATIVTERTPRANDTVRRQAEATPAAETPLALPPQRATAIVPQAAAPQAATALPDLIAPTSGQAPAKAVAPTAADGTQSVVVDPGVAARPAVTPPADEPATVTPAAAPKMKAEPTAIATDAPAETPKPVKPARDADDDTDRTTAADEADEADDKPESEEPMVEDSDEDAPAAESAEEMADEKPDEAASDEPAPAPKKPRVANLFDEIEDDDVAAPADDTTDEPEMDESEMTEEPGDDEPAAAGDDAAEPEMVEDPADAPADADEAPQPTAKDAAEGEPGDEPAEEAAEPEMTEEPGDGEPAEADGDAAEPEMVEEPGDDEPAEEAAEDGESKPRAQEADAGDAAFTAPAEPLRRWVDGTGAHQTRGWLVAATATHVRILKVNGRFTTVKLDTLSPADRDYVSDVVVRMAAQRRAAPPRIDTAGL